METNGQLLVHWVSRGQGVISNLHSTFLIFRGPSSQPWKIHICRLVMKSAWWHFDKAPISSLTKFWQDVHFHAFTLLFCRLHLNIWSNGQLLNKRRHEKNHKHKESKLRLNTTLPLLSRLRLTKAGRSNNYSAQTSGFFRCPLIFIFSLHHHPH